MTQFQMFVHRLNRILAGMQDLQIEFVPLDKLDRKVWELDELDSFIRLGLPLPSFLEPTNLNSLSLDSESDGQKKTIKREDLDQTTVFGSVFSFPLVIEKSLVGAFVLSHVKSADSILLFQIGDLIDWLFTSSFSTAERRSLAFEILSTSLGGPSDLQSDSTAFSQLSAPAPTPNSASGSSFTLSSSNQSTQFSNVVLFKPRSGSTDLASLFKSKSPQIDDEQKESHDPLADLLNESFTASSVADNQSEIHAQSILQKPMIIEVSDLTLDMRLMALSLHEMSSRWAFISSQDMPQNIFESVAGVQDLGSMTLMVPQNQQLDEHQMHTLEGYAEQYEVGLHPQILIFRQQRETMTSDRLVGFHRIKCSLDGSSTMSAIREWWKGLDETIRELNQVENRLHLSRLPLDGQSANLLAWKHNIDPSSNPN